MLDTDRLSKEKHIEEIAFTKHCKPQKKHCISQNLRKSVGELLSFFAAILKNIVGQVKENQTSIRFRS